eukprot:3943112-Pyramimonas_sp.AAC.1
MLHWLFMGARRADAAQMERQRRPRERPASPDQHRTDRLGGRLAWRGVAGAAPRRDEGGLQLILLCYMSALTW